MRTFAAGMRLDSSPPAARRVLFIVLAGVVYFYPTYSHGLLLLGFLWDVTAPPFMLLLAMRTEHAEVAS